MNIFAANVRAPPLYLLQTSREREVAGMNRSLTTTSLRTHTAVASGYLHKLTHNGTPFARWHQRYYVLYSDGLLRSYKSSRARNSNRVIHVGRKCLRVRFGAETRRDECSRWPKHCPPSLRFSVINSDREYHFYCESEREFVVWRDSLRQILRKLGSAHSSYVERRGSKMAKGDRDSASDNDSSTGAPTPAGSLRKSKPRARPRYTEEKRRERLVEMERSKEKEIQTSFGDGYDSMGPAIPYTDLDEEEEEESEKYEVEKEDPLNEPQSSTEELLRQDPARKTEFATQNFTDDEVMPDLISEIRWSTSNYGKRNKGSNREKSSRTKKSVGHTSREVEAAFLEVQAILDETFNDMC